MQSLKALLGFILLVSISQARIFDSLVSYRQGGHAVNEDAFTIQGEEELDVPDSVDNAFGYTKSNAEDDSIEVVHCYSMRNGLYGKATEARVIWTKIDFSSPTNRRSGVAENERSISIPIDSNIEQFAVYETDMTVFLLS